MTQPPSISALLKKYNLRPQKGLGQNFLVDSHHLDRIIAAAELSSLDTVLEIGPGPGALTHRLAEVAGQVIAVELDPGMVNLLRQELSHHPNLTIIQADILQTDLSTILASQPANQPYKVVANLPYYITAAVLRHLLEAAPRPHRIVVTVQKEVAQRIVAQPGEMSVLAVSVQFYGRPRLVHHIPAGAFYPPPNVDSAVIQIDTFAEPAVSVPDVSHFFTVVKAGFGQKRKQLKNSLRAGLRLPANDVLSAMQKVGIAPTRRAETLSLAEWVKLAEILSTTAD